MTNFYAADVGRQITASGGVVIITAVTDGSTVTVDIIEAFPADAFNDGAWRILGSPMTTVTSSAKDPVGQEATLTLDRKRVVKGKRGWGRVELGGRRRHRNKNNTKREQER